MDVVGITPDNAAKYKTEIKQILRELVEQNENITFLQQALFSLLSRFS